MAKKRMTAPHALAAALLLGCAAPAAQAQGPGPGPAASAPAAVPAQLRVCGDTNEFPPFTIAVREGGRRTGAVSGYNVDMLNRILQASGRSAAYTLLPWKRCLAMAAEGHFDLVLDAVKAPERERYFAFPPVFYTLTPVVVFHRSYPNPPDMNVPDDLSKIKVCTPLGWDFSLAGIKTPPTDSNPATIEAAVAMLKIGRCEALMFEMEVVPGLPQVNGRPLINEQDFVLKPLRWRPKSDFFVVVSRALPYREPLLHLLAQGIGALRKSGEAARLLQLHLPSGGKPR
jgi:ABC-type amino acid transport substrate-binding protein